MNSTPATKNNSFKKPLPDWTFPLVLLGVLILAFGLLIPLLGFYWDDWPAVTAARLRGVSVFWDFFKGERPFSAWTYILSFPILGTRPLVWHIFTLALRWLAVLAMWWTLRGVWPDHTREANWIALVFAIYPVFTEQPVAVAFSQHWITFGLYFLSLGAMVWAYRKPRWFWPLTGLALFAEAVHVLTMEYFWGLELMRPFLLWIILNGQATTTRQKLVKVLKGWLPYLIVLAAGLIVRMLFFVSPASDPNRPDLLYSLQTQPFTTLVRLVQLSLQDLVNNLIGAWYTTIQPGSIDLTDRVYLFSLLVGLLAAGFIFYYLFRIQSGETQDSANRRIWIRQALLIGLLGTFLGPVPVWLTDRGSIWGIWGGRFALAAMFGLSILLFALLEWFTQRPLPKILLVAGLVGLAVGFHLRNATQYYRSTLKQNQFYWQLYWRAPYLKPNTAILSNDELFSLVGRPATAMAVNLLYPQQVDSDRLGYWFLELENGVGPKNVPRLARDIDLKPTFRNFSFLGKSLDSLVIYYKSGIGRCLWVLSEEDADNTSLPPLTLQALPATNLSQIVPEPISDSYPSTQLFGKEPVHDWCYYFEKADLARQLQDWNKVVELGDQAAKIGYTPSDANEWLPFIQGYALTEQWEKALERTNSAYQMDADVSPRLCRVWQNILNVTTGSNQSAPPAEILEKIHQTQTQLQCPAPSADNSPG